MYRKQLISLSALVTFEAAARLLSFTRAAAELNVTQAAVSRQIRLLESRTDTKLFLRGHRKISLTPEGEVLLQAMSQSLQIITGALADIQSTKDNELVISALVAFSNLWLSPKLPAFQRQHPKLNVRVIATNEYENLAASEIDVSLRFGDGKWKDGEAIFLFQDRVFPAASADYVAKHAPVVEAFDVTAHNLIDSNVKYPGWLGWNDWLKALGYKGSEVKVGTWYSYYNDAVSAALNGQGILLGWNALILDHLHSGRLQKLTNDEVLTEAAHYAVISPSSGNKPSVQAFVSWLQSACAA